MKALASILGVVLAIIGLSWLIKSRVAEQDVIRLADVPRVFERVLRTGSDGSFAVFMFSDEGRLGPDGQVNLQFSVENGEVGLDWVMLGSVNVRDEERIFKFLQTRGAMPKQMEGNGVRYIRAEEGDLAALCQRIMGQLYRVGPDDDIDLVVEGFTWGK